MQREAAVLNDVYLDVLIFENTVMNCVILHITSVAVSRRVKWYRLLAGALTGTVYAVSAVWMTALTYITASKIILSLIMVTVTFPPRSIRSFVRTAACFYGVTFLFAGISFALLLSGPVRYTANIIVTVCTGYIIVITVIGYVRKRRAAANITADVYIQFDSASEGGVWLTAIVDSGNMLRDPLSGDAVIIAELSALEGELPCEIYGMLKSGAPGTFYDASVLSDTAGWSGRFRIIPYKALGNENGILPAFKADIVRVGDKEHIKQELNGVTVCLYESALSDDKQYRALIAPEMIA